MSSRKGGRSSFDAYVLTILSFFFICRLALGARAVLIGRPYVWGLAHSGEEGVKHVLQLLRDEFIMALQLCGCTKLSDIEAEHVMHHQRYLAKL